MTSFAPTKRVTGAASLGSSRAVVRLVGQLVSIRSDRAWLALRRARGGAAPRWSSGSDTASVCGVVTSGAATTIGGTNVGASVGASASSEGRVSEDDSSTGGGTTGTRSGLGVELLVGCRGASTADRYRPQSAAYSSIVDGGAGPLDLIAEAFSTSSAAGVSAAASRRQQRSRKSRPGSDPPCALTTP
jgi:hypothetical protein